jgi:hypothetical protein
MSLAIRRSLSGMTRTAYPAKPCTDDGSVILIKVITAKIKTIPIIIVKGLEPGIPAIIVGRKIG